MKTDTDVMQWGPYPTILYDIVSRVRIEPGWSLQLTSSEFERDEDHGRGAAGGLTLIVTAVVPDTYHPENSIGIRHFFPVPGATYNKASWTRWVFDCYTKVRLHECMEHFQVEDPNNIEPDDKCIRCHHHAESHDGRDSSCAECDGYPHRFAQETNRTFRPFVPNHGPGEDVYVVREMNSDERARTQYTGGKDHRGARPEGWG